MPELPRYPCHRTTTPLPLDGSLTHPAWEQAPWTSDFVDIAGPDATTPRFRTRAKLLYDDQYLYVGGQLEEPHVWSTMTEPNTWLYEENNFELFLDPDGDGQNYYEFEINPLGTIWELSLPKPYSEGGVPVDPDNLPGLRTAVRINGTLNDPADTDSGWTVEAAFPWADLAKYNLNRTPPAAGDEWRMNLMRIEWDHEVVDGDYRKGKQQDFWVWSPQYVLDMHKPDQWGVLRFE
ncbi:carbohydrate-binding family 9-like protein [Kribbella sp. CA-293567]|uniref:carbohydrate-binding family 9-like protein n=1 Tax=Kribbella sp. CA-293567 TaxID=3002436 RepID=UPI0022DD4656|nr:carbohydrate-binding family 9-like protein [Kribbella sp. CA-293567]WBQ04999.1 carbohydrate-binding family 9-like protein [Kribbella sp. CA-293567]